jgi:predicted nucleic acid-binding Zn ribbon protein
MTTLEAVEVDLCAVCGKQLEKDSRSNWCSGRCKGRDWDARMRVQEVSERRGRAPSLSLTAETQTTEAESQF